MKHILILLVLISFNSKGETIEGDWLTIGEASGLAESVVRININDNVLSGNIVDIFDFEKRNLSCKKCSEPNKDKPLLGLKILSSFECKDQQCTKGMLLDPKTGKKYSSIIKLKDKDTLEVRGYIGSPRFGRSQIWKRSNENKDTTINL